MNHEVGRARGSLVFSMTIGFSNGLLLCVGAYGYSQKCCMKEIVICGDTLKRLFSTN